MAVVHNRLLQLCCSSMWQGSIREKAEQKGREFIRGPLSSDKEDNFFKVGSAFMEAAFNTKLNVASRKKEMAKLGMLNCK